MEPKIEYEDEFNDEQKVLLAAEIKAFKETFLFHVFTKDMKDQAEVLQNTLIPGNLSDIGSVLLRENGLGELRNFQTMATWFDKLEQQITEK